MLICSFAEANEISIGSKAGRLHWPVLPDYWRSVELAKIPFGIDGVEDEDEDDNLKKRDF